MAFLNNWHDIRCTKNVEKPLFSQQFPTHDLFSRTAAQGPPRSQSDNRTVKETPAVGKHTFDPPLRNLRMKNSVARRGGRRTTGFREVPKAESWSNRCCTIVRAPGHHRGGSSRKQDTKNSLVDDRGGDGYL